MANTYAHITRMRDLQLEKHKLRVNQEYHKQRLSDHLAMMSIYKRPEFLVSELFRVASPAIDRIAESSMKEIKRVEEQYYTPLDTTGDGLADATAVTRKEVETEEKEPAGDLTQNLLKFGLPALAGALAAGLAVYYSARGNKSDAESSADKEISPEDSVDVEMNTEGEYNFTKDSDNPDQKDKKPRDDGFLPEAGREPEPAGTYETELNA